LDLNEPIETANLEENLVYRIEIRPEAGFNPPTGEDAILNFGHANMVVLDNGNLSRFGRLTVDNAERGVISFVDTTGQLDGLAPGVRWNVFIDHLSAQVGPDGEDRVTLNNEGFTLLPTSRLLENFTSDLRTAGLVNRILVGGIQVRHGLSTNTHALLPLDVVSDVQIELATNFDPGTLLDTLEYDLIINNLTRGQSYGFNTADLFANGQFTLGDAGSGANNLIRWQKSGPLSTFTDAETGTAIDVSDLGDELEIRVERIRLELANGNQIAFPLAGQTMSFRALHTFS
ncbi:MAG TPA: hypothetical protein VEI97_14145, partial [bacterium]|nr:hypothetical protein [bacterium]